MPQRGDRNFKNDACAGEELPAEKGASVQGDASEETLNNEDELENLNFEFEKISCLGRWTPKTPTSQLGMLKKITLRTCTAILLMPLLPLQLLLRCKLHFCLLAPLCPNKSGG